MTLSDFISTYVMADVPGCPSAVAKRELINAAKKFLKETGAWNEVQDAIVVGDDAQEFDLEAPTGARCINIREIYTRAGRLIPKTIDELAQIMPDWQTAEGSAPVYYTRSFDFTTYRVYPKPTDPNGETLRVHAVYTLLDTATSIPNDIAERYSDALASGTKWKLMLMPRTTWQDLALAAYHKNEFEEAMSVAKITAEHGKTTGSPRVLPRRFGQ